ncbi:hypothetical protein IEQ34_007775 [Dendrobium chrysotoxum]|uniref:Uncharacterized protein n=1 Tax=Dendrobium chrysotoxum TaxID=161865 RepID=A0AAV7H6J3_DENCH|nr:hypothetical protein IEQ34_007775 [Dendrobium chrysotoxum]
MPPRLHFLSSFQQLSITCVLQLCKLPDLPSSLYLCFSNYYYSMFEIKENNSQYSKISSTFFVKIRKAYFFEDECAQWKAMIIRTNNK